MKFYNNIITVELPEIIIVKARNFANAVVQTTNYSDSNQFSAQKIKDDHFVSKLGEEAVKKAYSKYALVTGPDYSIYNPKNKSWNPDLYVNDVALAVKTQRRSIAQRYGLSWTFQCSSLRRDKILDEKDAWVCFVEYNDLHNAKPCLVYPAFQIKELIFKKPVLHKLVAHKLVVYAADLAVDDFLKDIL